MNNTILEITENEYCIKLDKASFDLSLIRQLIKRIQLDQRFYVRNTDIDQDDIISRNSSLERGGNFDHLSDK